MMSWTPLSGLAWCPLLGSELSRYIDCFARAMQLTSENGRTAVPTDRQRKDLLSGVPSLLIWMRLRRYPRL